ncbi:sensor histidine kinase [Hymenobacter pini]|uniref:sensor histidine kinase n=1 Tax=Hymenobacter pini TaxID=2880879 RepID=UPI001CF4192E|nr:ATP-binding protein [Hymenobacter pini]MCA8831503.1 HAMP domain-containing protein [Hymenobacter pini]
MNLKTKITLGFLALLLLLVGLGGYAFYTVQRLERGSRNVLRANLYSVQLGQNMLRALDHMTQPQTVERGLQQFRQNLTREAGNITEVGEKELVDSLTQNLADYVQLHPSTSPITTSNQSDLLRLRQQTLRMVQLNMQALTSKNDHANASATKATQYLLAFVGLSVLVALLFVLSVPEAAVGPLRKLFISIEHATAQDFTATIPVESHDEFGRVADAFNRMLVQLKEYRASTTAELITERNRAAGIVNSLDEGLVLLDQNRQILLVNPVASQLLEVPAEQLVGRPATEAARGNDLLRELLKPLDSSRRAGADAPLLTIAQQGEEVYYRLDVQDLVIFNEALDKMEFVGQILALRNVSDFKRLDQVKSNFLATVSHELKTPLSSMNINLRLLQDERLPIEERQRVIQSVRQETQRLQRMVAELLDVSRLDAGAGIQLDVRPTDMRDLVRYATDTVQAQLNDKQLQLTVQLPSDLPLVRADVEKTTWVLINLLANAIRYSPIGETLVVQSEIVGTQVQVSVQDHGPGIAAEHHERIFQRFAQVPDKTGYRGGSGLGLSIAREFITSQGGRLWVESELGSGSTFRFTLPLSR